MRGSRGRPAWLEWTTQQDAVRDGFRSAGAWRGQAALWVGLVGPGSHGRFNADSVGRGHLPQGSSLLAGAWHVPTTAPHSCLFGRNPCYDFTA